LTYQSHETSAAQLKGRINVTRQLRGFLRGSASIEQTITELASENPQHALLSWASKHLQHNASPRIASYVRDATRDLPPSKAPLTRGTAQRAVHTRRQDRHWAPALELASALYLYQGVDDGMAGPSLPGMVFNTWRLFESLVRHIVQAGLVQHSTLRYGGRGHKVWLTSTTVRPRPLMPDCLVFQGTGCAAVIDAKNKAGRPAPSDLYQLRTYLTHYGAPVGALAYPSTTRAHAIEVGIRYDDVLGPRIITWGVDVTKAINHVARINCSALLA
jgi:5-methylcytosine-specific restriction endonuclease McrBC regulatory subunit McrC